MNHMKMISRREEGNMKQICSTEEKIRTIRSKFDHLKTMRMNMQHVRENPGEKKR